MPKSTWTIIRHGQTTANNSRIIQGQNYPSSLTDLGKSQATVTGNVIKNEIFDACFSSDIERANNTAEIMISKLDHNVDINHSFLLRERSFGDLEGSDINKVAEILKTVDIATLNGETANQI